MDNATGLTVGWVGLGSQGGPMARALAVSGVATTLWARRPETLEAYRDTPALVATSVSRLLMDVDVLCLCVRNDDDVREMLWGPAHTHQELNYEPPMARMRRGATIVVHSTIHPGLAVEVEQEAAKYGVGVVDAPVSGGGPKAEARSLVVMASGDPATVERVMPILQAYGNPIAYLGAVGAGQRAKLINNLLLTANMGVAASAFALAKELGVDPASLQVVLHEGSGRSFGAQMVGGDDWDLSRASAVAGPLLQKDARLLVDLAESSGVKAGVVLDAADAALGSMSLPR